MTPNNESATTSIIFKSLSVTMEMNPTATAEKQNTDAPLLSFAALHNSLSVTNGN